MFGGTRSLVCIALAAHALTQSACSVERSAHPAFRGGDCDAGQRNYEGFCLPYDANPGSMSSGIRGDAGAGSAGRPANDAGGAQTEPGDASAPVSGAGGASGSASGASGAGDDSGVQPPSDCQPTAETCNDRDDDCDGRNDEQTDVACYDDAAGCVADASSYTCRGLCRTGVRRCSDGELGDCDGQVLPASADACTSAGDLAADEDCDGLVDERCACSGESQACYSGPAGTRDVPPCRPGTQTCRDGVFGACEDQVLPTAETCGNPGQDDDCDGDPDDVPLLGGLCTEPSNMGMCATGTWQCDGDALACATPAPVVELCDRRDQDCDGHIDEDFDLQSDSSHCGMCGRRCAGAQRCCAAGCVDVATSNNHCGECGVACGTGQTCCGGACRDLQNDAVHCGACGRTCGSGETCCGGSCVNTNTHADHCGECGNDCGANVSCCGGTCYNLNSAQDHCGACGNACGVLEGCCRGMCRLLSLGC